MLSLHNEYRKHDKITYFWLKVQTCVSHTSMYLYVLSTYFFAYSCSNFFLFRKGTYWVHADSGGVRLFGSWFYCAPAGQPSRFACERFRHRPTHWTKALAGLFTAAWQPPCQCLSSWELALAACWEIQLWRVSFTRFAAALISCLLTSSTSSSPQRSALCERACEGLGLQVGSMMCCKIFKQTCKVQVQRFYQRDKTKSWSGLQLSSADGDGDVDHELRLQCCECYCSNFQAILPISYINN